MYERLFQNFSTFCNIKAVIVRILKLIPRRYETWSIVDLSTKAETLCIKHVEEISFAEELKEFQFSLEK